MNDFKKKGGFGGDNKRGRMNGGFPQNDGHSFSRPNFGGKAKFGGPKPYGRPIESREMFQATCASCGKTCEVPFKPNGMKPVYCKECFDKNGGKDASPRNGNDRFQKKSFDRSSFNKPSFNKPEFREASRLANDSGMNDVKKQLESLNYKMDKLITLFGENASKAEIPAPKVEIPKIKKEKALRQAQGKKTVSKNKK